MNMTKTEFVSGNSFSLSIRCRLLGDTIDGDLAGTLEITVAGKPVGRPEVAFSLYQALDSLKWLARDRGNRMAQNLVGRPAEQIVDLIRRNFDGELAPGSVDYIEEPARLDITPTVDPFGSAALFFVAETQLNGRIVAIDLEKDVVWETQVQLNDAEEQLSSLFRFIESLEEQRQLLFAGRKSTVE